MRSFQNILPSYNNCYMLLAIVTKSIFNLLCAETFIPYSSETTALKISKFTCSLYSLQDLPIYSNCVKLWHKQKKTTIDCTCHSCWLRDQLRKQELEDGGIDVPSFEKVLFSFKLYITYPL